MNTPIAIALAMLGAVGVVLVAAGLIGTTSTDPAEPPARERSVGRLDTRVVGGLGAAVVAFALTGWVAAALLAGVAAWGLPLAMGARGRRAEAMARTEALATWAEQLRDTMRAAAGLHEAIGATATVAPLAIRPHVDELARRLRRESFRTAMARFATDVDDPIGDKIVASLVLASERRAANLADMLGEIAVSARQQATMQLRVEAGRARLYTQTLVVCGLTAFVVAALVLLNRDYLTPYDSSAGQTVLVGIGALFLASGAGLLTLGDVARTPRILRVSSEANR